MPISFLDRPTTYPSYEDLPKVPRLGPDPCPFTRLVIGLEGSLCTAVSVMNEERDPDAPWEPYCEESEHGLVFHPISQDLLCDDQPISSIQTKVGHLSRWEQAWLMVFDDCNPRPPGDGVHTIWAPPREGEEPDDDKTGLSLMYAAGEHRPPNYDKPLVVKAQDKAYLTVHEYLTVIRPYLITRRQDILGSLIISTQYDPSLPADTKLIASGFGETLTVETEEKWMGHARGRKIMWENLNDPKYAPGFAIEYDPEVFKLFV
ncbi:hypothetical protein F5X68DRAFT_196279 [Plectosphaerella plurivora]|uniref:Uncharacterized protein n=1 Tax=Plectosphaerella plurivora TaxID=936078 RepID=A0A9P8VJY6_9PEZI|nr:hypothetical protein F5X68DRAFT_196279 [Plectosphaerella plurivora]